MTQTRTGQMIGLELVPLQDPETAPDSATHFAKTGSRTVQLGAAETSQRFNPQTATTRLHLHPGDLSELVIRIKNRLDVPLQLQFGVTGDMPSEWWQLRTEGDTLPVHHQMEAVLYLAIAADFFERPFSPEQLPLRLDYKGQLKVTAITPRGDSEEHLRPFTVLVRPPSLYLDFLPDIYRRVDIVGRFLKIFETTFEPTVDILDHLWAYLDPLTAPTSMLPFLAHWVGWDFDGPLSVEQQRTLIRYAVEIYRWRGTRRSLRFYLHLASGLPLDDHLPDESQKSIGIHENFNQGHVLGQSLLGQSAILGGSRPYYFCVRLRPPADYDLDEALIRRIIDQEKPAFCRYDLWIEPRP